MCPSHADAFLLQDLAFNSEPQDVASDAIEGGSACAEWRPGARANAPCPDNGHALGLRLDSETQVGVDAEAQGEALGGRGLGLGLRLDSETQPGFGPGEAQPEVRPCCYSKLGVTWKSSCA